MQPTTETPRHLVEILQLGPRGQPDKKRIGYWRSVKSEAEAPTDYPRGLGIAPLVPGGPHAYAAESAVADLEAFDAGEVETRADRPDCGAEIVRRLEVALDEPLCEGLRAALETKTFDTARVRSRMIFADDVLGVPDEVRELKAAGKDEEALKILSRQTFTSEQLRVHLSECCDRALARLAAWKQLPWPGDYLDPEMPRERRQVIVDALRSFPIVERYCGNSPSRLSIGGICGGAERANDEWVWPVGLEHYVTDHGLLLPPEFLKSIGVDP